MVKKNICGHLIEAQILEIFSDSVRELSESQLRGLLLTEQNTYTLADLGMLGLESGYYLWQRHGEAGFGHRREAQTLRHRLGLMDKLSQT